MGLGNDDVSAVDDEGGTDSSVGGNGSKKCFGGSVSCSICLEVVVDNGDRSWAKLQCGHQFHLGTRNTLTSPLEGDKQQLQQLYNACIGIPQIAKRGVTINSCDQSK